MSETESRPRYNRVILKLSGESLTRAGERGINMEEVFVIASQVKQALELGCQIGLVVGGGVLYLIAILGDWLFKKESMGGGDIKMTAMLGAFLGWQKVVLIFFGGAVIGLLVSIILLVISKDIRSSRVIPFGPFLASAAMIAIIYGDSIISFYLKNFFSV